MKLPGYSEHEMSFICKHCGERWGKHISAPIKGVNGCCPSNCMQAFENAGHAAMCSVCNTRSGLHEAYSMKCPIDGQSNWNGKYRVRLSPQHPDT